ncbi:hypothetical protein PoB_001922000 [Plakobranchus ocellatus]|uniref:Uncharacterized protein n=1 Tax=Plakobranchus ocellatus TaxID=259542 RepID=A0AAV3ZC49_9GAST|nr:hypothetical protein PoB_001922000 [Plakobranchus ocellatus]
MNDIRRAADPEWQRKAQDQRKWKTSTESYILQWMDKASNNNNKVLINWFLSVNQCGHHVEDSGLNSKHGCVVGYHARS